MKLLGRKLMSRESLSHDVNKSLGHRSVRSAMMLGRVSMVILGRALV